jgi:hypothetical protein
MIKQTAIEWLENEITNRITRRNPYDTIIIQTLGDTLIKLINQAKQIEIQQSHEYAEFAIKCDREGINILEFDGFINLK